MNFERHYWLYVIQLEQGKYYVGVRSRTPEARFNEHVNGLYAVEWTKVYKPIKIDQVVDLGVTTIERTETFENKVTRRYIKTYGIDNVRGGKLTYRGKYVMRFGFYYTDKDWQVIISNLFSLGLALYVLIDLIFDKRIFALWY